MSMRDESDEEENEGKRQPGPSKPTSRKRSLNKLKVESPPTKKPAHGIIKPRPRKPATQDVRTLMNGDSTALVTLQLELLENGIEPKFVNALTYAGLNRYHFDGDKHYSGRKRKYNQNWQNLRNKIDKGATTLLPANRGRPPDIDDEAKEAALHETKELISTRGKLELRTDKEIVKDAVNATRKRRGLPPCDDDFFTTKYVERQLKNLQFTNRKVQNTTENRVAEVGSVENRVSFSMTVMAHQKQFGDMNLDRTLNVDGLTLHGSVKFAQENIRSVPIGEAAPLKLVKSRTGNEFETHIRDILRLGFKHLYATAANGAILDAVYVFRGGPDLTQTVILDLPLHVRSDQPFGKSHVFITQSGALDATDAAAALKLIFTPYFENYLRQFDLAQELKEEMDRESRDDLVFTLWLDGDPAQIKAIKTLLRKWLIKYNVKVIKFCACCSEIDQPNDRCKCGHKVIKADHANVKTPEEEVYYEYEERLKKQAMNVMQKHRDVLIDDGLLRSIALQLARLKKVFTEKNVFDQLSIRESWEGLCPFDAITIFMRCPYFKDNRKHFEEMKKFLDDEKLIKALLNEIFETRALSDETIRSIPYFEAFRNLTPQQILNSRSQHVRQLKEQRCVVLNPPGDHKHFIHYSGEMALAKLFKEKNLFLSRWHTQVPAFDYAAPNMMHTEEKEAAFEDCCMICGVDRVALHIHIDVMQLSKVAVEYYDLLGWWQCEKCLGQHCASCKLLQGRIPHIIRCQKRIKLGLNEVISPNVLYKKNGNNLVRYDSVAGYDDEIGGTVLQDAYKSDQQTWICQANNCAKKHNWTSKTKFITCVNEKKTTDRNHVPCGGWAKADCLAKSERDADMFWCLVCRSERIVRLHKAREESLQAAPAAADMLVVMDDQHPNEENEDDDRVVAIMPEGEEDVLRFILNEYAHYCRLNLDEDPQDIFECMYRNERKAAWTLSGKVLGCKPPHEIVNEQKVGGHEAELEWVRLCKRLLDLMYLALGEHMKGVRRLNRGIERNWCWKWYGKHMTIWCELLLMRGMIDISVLCGIPEDADNETKIDIIRSGKLLTKGDDVAVWPRQPKESKNEAWIARPATEIFVGSYMVILNDDHGDFVDFIRSGKAIDVAKRIDQHCKHYKMKKHQDKMVFYAVNHERWERVCFVNGIIFRKSDENSMLQYFEFDEDELYKLSTAKWQGENASNAQRMVSMVCYGCELTGSMLLPRPADENGGEMSTAAPGFESVNGYYTSNRRRN